MAYYTSSWKRDKGARGSRFDLDAEPEPQATWNMTQAYLEVLLHNMVSIQSTIGYVHIHDKESIIKILPMFQLTYDLIRPPLKFHFQEIMFELDVTFEVLRDLQKKMNPILNEPGQRIPVLTEEARLFAEGVSLLYRQLTEAIYRMGLGIIIKRGMSIKEKTENALLG